MRLLLCLVLLLLAAVPVRADDPAANSLASALSAMRSGAWSEATALARRAGGVAPDIIEWHRLRAGRGSFEEAQAFLARRSDWPGLAYLRARTEDVVPLAAEPEEVVAFFAGERPQTGSGSLALVAAYEALGRGGDAAAQAVLAWLTQPLDARVEAALIARYADELADLHEARLDMLLWDRHGEAARRMLPRVDDNWRRLAEARLALSGDVPGVDLRIEAVPAWLRDHPGLAYERFAWRARRGRDVDAIELMLEHSPDRLGRPDKWAGSRRVLAREAMRAGRAELAYRLAAGHGLVEGSDYADLEWLAGFVALTDLDDPEAARGHFRRFRAAVQTPISFGRAGYWEGRAEEALGNAEAAREAYAFGARWQTSFYGQLAAERAGLPMDPALTGREAYPAWEDLEASRSSVMAAAELLLAAGSTSLAERFMVHLTERLSAEEIGSLADRALALREPHIALKIAKYAASRAIVLPRAYYPVVDLGLDSLPVSRRLALSIARRESEFDPVVVSPAGARGLMQLMPGTASDVSRDLGLSYSPVRLLTDPAYNARLGTQYLAKLIDRFGPNIILIAAGYNAGPGRPARWIEIFGDPRYSGTDVVDWIEHIPFNETRNYVMRVAESLPVYTARLSGETGPIGLMDALTAR